MRRPVSENEFTRETSSLNHASKNLHANGSTVHNKVNSKPELFSRQIATMRMVKQL